MRLVNCLVVAGLAFLMGCSSTLEVQPHHEKYGVQCIKVYGETAGASVEPADIIAEGDEIEQFPLVWVKPGETAKGDDLTAVIVAESISEVDGVPRIREEDRCVVELGKSIKVNLRKVYGHMASLNYEITDRALLEFAEIQSYDGSHTLKLPAFTSSSMDSTVHCELNRWYFLGFNGRSSTLIRVIAPDLGHLKDFCPEQIKRN